MNWLTQIFQSAFRSMQFWVTVAAWEQGVLVRLGKHTHHLMPGVHLRLPFVDRVVIVCVRERVADTPNSTVTTTDGKTFTFGCSLRYSVVDLRKMLKAVARPESTLSSLAVAAGAKFISESHSRDVTAEHVAQAVDSSLDGPLWGLSDVQSYVVTLAQGRVFRVLQAYDDKYSSAIDRGLDDKPCKTI